jgi:hypothetical protein
MPQSTVPPGREPELCTRASQSSSVPACRVAGGPPSVPDDIGAGTFVLGLLLPFPLRPASAQSCGLGGRARRKAGDHGVQGRSPAFRVRARGKFGKPRRHLTLGRVGWGSTATRPPKPVPAGRRPPPGSVGGVSALRTPGGPFG